MRVIGFIISAGLALAALRLALTVLMVAYLRLLIIAMLTKPTETVAMLGFFLLCFLLTEHTAAMLGTACVVILACAIAKRRER